MQKITREIGAFSIYQILGGLFGIGLTVKLITDTNSFSTPLLIMFFSAISLYLYSVFCGFLLLKNIVHGLMYSKINQLLQVFHFNIFGYSFKYVSAIHFSPGIDLTELLKFELEFGFTTWHISFILGGSIALEPFIILHLNLVAILIIIFIDKQLSKIKAANDEEIIRQLVNSEKDKN